jgi:acetylornithine deacetylase/succinyl-diaminopimelate desuccinylase-like protein
MDETLRRVVSPIDDRADDIVRFASAFRRRPSVNPDLEPNAEAERPAQPWLRDQVLWAVSFDHVDMWESAAGRPNLVATRTGTGGGRSPTWAGRTDLVPVTSEQAERWRGEGAFSGEVRDGRLWGRGASDTKGAIAA